jgi:hypothetical protein
MEYMTHVLELMSRAEHANAQRLALPADAPLSPHSLTHSPPPPRPVQDAMEYMTHVLELMSRAEHANAQRLTLPADAPLSPAMFNFQLEDRIQCHTSNCVSYRSDWAGSLCRTMHASKRCCRGGLVQETGWLRLHAPHACQLCHS